MATLKDLFPGRFPKSEVKIKEIWNNSLVVFDTNIYLNMYRYSEKTRSELLEIMDRFQERIWMPYQVASEFLNGRMGEIRRQVTRYAEARKLLQDIEENFSNHRSHPFITDNTLRSLKRVFNRVNDELKTSEAELSKRLQNDEILEKVVDFTANRIGKEFTKKQYEDIFAEGEQRYRDKVPPGYRDYKKAQDKTNFAHQKACFGDLIIWKEIIDEAKRKKINVIFISDDGKEDWWLEEGGKTISARPELHAEFKHETEMDFLMYAGLNFMRHAAEYLNVRISKASLAEIKEQSEVEDRTYSHLELIPSGLAQDLEKYKLWESSVRHLLPENYKGAYRLVAEMYKSKKLSEVIQLKRALEIPPEILSAVNRANQMWHGQPSDEIVKATQFASEYINKVRLENMQNSDSSSDPDDEESK